MRASAPAEAAAAFVIAMLASDSSRGSLPVEVTGQIVGAVVLSNVAGLARVAVSVAYPLIPGTPNPSTEATAYDVTLLQDAATGAWTVLDIRLRR